jgi:type II secretory pathway component PulF
VFLASVAAVIIYGCLVFFLPHLEALWRESREPMSALQIWLVRTSRILSNAQIAIIVLIAFAASLVWRLLAAKRLRESAA